MAVYFSSWRLVKFCVKLVLISSLIDGFLASTHWVVTEDGKIQEQVYSVFYMRRPYDLVALMQQEKRAKLMENFTNRLDGQIEEIDGRRDKDMNLQDTFYVTDKDCILAGKPLVEFDLFVSTVAACKPIEISLEKSVHKTRKLTNGDGKSPLRPLEPNCVRVSDLDFTMQDFESLKSLKDRTNISITPEVDLIHLLPNVESAEYLRHFVYEALERNKTSWIYYNLAGYYYRILGDALKALDCVSRALHFSPRDMKHVALLNLGNILHRSHHSQDASLVLLAAVNIAPHDAMLHYTLGNIYAALTEFNKSVESYEFVLKLQPEFEATVLRRHAVLCRSKLEQALEKQYDSLQKTLMELGDFEQRLDFWQKQQLKLLQEQASIEVRLASQIDYTEWKIRQQLQNEVQKINKQIQPDDGSEQKKGMAKKKDCAPVVQNGQLVPGCGSQPVVANVKIHLGHTWSQLFKEIEIQAAELKEELLVKQNELNSKISSSSGEQTFVINSKYPRQPSKHTLTEPPPKYLLPNWPSGGDCEEIESKEKLVLSLPAFIPPENKGFEVGRLLGELRVVSAQESPSPVCEAETSAEFDTLWDWIFGNIEAHDDEVSVARTVLRQYIDECCGESVSFEEFGHRLTIAMEQNLMPKWLLYHMAFYYWWALGDMGNFSKCLVSTKIMAPRECKDMILVPVASLMGRGGLLIGAIYSAKFALQANEFEPTTNRLLADLYVLSGDLENALVHYKKVLQEEPEDRDTLKSYLWVSCRQKHNPDNEFKFEDVTLHKNDDSADWIEFVENKADGHCYSSSQTESSHCSQRTTHPTSDSEPTVALEDSNEDDSDDGSPIENLNIKEYVDPQQQQQLDSSGREPQRIHLKLSLGHGSVLSSVPPLSQASMVSPLKPPVEDDPLPDILLQVPNNPGIPQPEPSECRLYPQTNFKHFTSTWLSVSAKGVDVSKLLDTPHPITGPPMQPYCNAHLPSSALTLDHLAGIKHRATLSYSAETGLREALQTLGREREGPESVERMGTRLAHALQKNTTSWVLTTLSALYWRVIGQAEQAVICLREALHHAPHQMRDIPLISLANVFHRAGLYNDALIVAHMALKVSPGFVVIHFTLANIFAAKGNLDQARAFYESTLALQSSFEPARDRLRAIYCNELWEGLNKDSH